MSHSSDIEAWALDFGPTVVISFILAILVSGRVIHHFIFVNSSVCGTLMVPPSIISGAIGLVFMGVLSSIDELLASSLLDGLGAVKSTMVNFTFTALIFGLYSRNNQSKVWNVSMLIHTIFTEGFPMLLYLNVITWGQSFACTLITSILTTCGANVPVEYGALVPLGLEQGTDFLMEASELTESHAIVAEEAESLGLLVTVVTSIAVISCKALLISKGFIDPQGSKHFQQGDGASEAFSRGASGSSGSVMAMKRATSLSNMEASEGGSEVKTANTAGLGVHLAVIALPSFVAFSMALGYHTLQVTYLPFLGLLPGTRLFRISMVVALVGLVGLQRCAPVGVLRFSRETMLTLCGLTLDLIFVTSLARSLPRPHKTTHYEVVSFLVCVCLAVNLAAYVFLGRRYFPNYKFERSLVVSAGCLGNVVCSLFLSRVLDPMLLSPVPSAYTSSLLLFFFPSTTAKNKIMMGLVRRVGGWGACLVAGCFSWVWIIIFTGHVGGPGAGASAGVGSGLAAAVGSSASGSGGDKPGSLEMGLGAGGRRKSKSRRNASLSHTAHTADSRGGSDEEDGGDGDNERSALLERGDESDGVGLTQSAGAGAATVQVHLSEPSEILSPAQLCYIEGWLPADKQSRRWSLRYSLLRDGASLDTLLYMCSAHASGRRSASGTLMAPLGFVLLVEDSRSYKFGAFLSHVVEARASYDIAGGHAGPSSAGAAGGAGTGESFVFTYHADNPRGDVYRWTGRNDCFFLASARSGLCIGGGSSGAYALQLDDELDLGSSSTCETYDNACLASGEYFKCLNVEVYEVAEFV